MKMKTGTSPFFSAQRKGINYNRRLSDAIAWLRFPLIFFIIMLHCYSVKSLEGSHDTYFKLVYPLALWLGETGVPGFFFISGYLFFLSKKSYPEKLKGRLRTLLVPYLLWNALLFSLYVALYATGHPQDINGRSMADYGFVDYLRLFWDRGTYDDGNFVPLLCPLWYIRNLMLMSVFSPILFYAIRYLREFLIVGLAFWWMTTYHNAFIPQTLLFFSLGAYFSLLGINPLEQFTKAKFLLFSLFFVCAMGDIVSHTFLDTPINLQIHRASLILNIPVLLLLADLCTRKGWACKTLTDATFIVFCVHYPIVVALRKITIGQFSDASDTTHFLLYLACVVISTLLSLMVYQILDKHFPRFKNIMTGSR